jgi:hypothetical protein
VRLTDWRGNEYGVGDTILYARMSGRSCEISEATVVDIWETYQADGSWKWLRLEEGQEPPMRQYWNYGTRENETRPANVETRVKVQPTGRDSRSFGRDDYDYVDGVRVAKTPRAVTLQINQNVTAVTSD